MGRYHFMHEAWDDVDPVAVHFIKTCLEMDYRRRLSVSSLLDHPWLAFSDIHPLSSAHTLSTNGATILSSRLSHNLSLGGLHRTSMAAVAFQMPTKKANLLRSLFQEIDVDRTGSVDSTEFKAAMRAVDSNLSEHDISVLFNAMDLDGDKEISFIEFVAATIDPREVDIQELNRAFRLLDTEGKGFITKDDLMRVVGHDCTNETVAGGAAAIESYSSASYHPAQVLEGYSSLGDSFDRYDSCCDAKNGDRGKKLAEKMSHIINKADVNKDGVVSYTEFLFAMADGQELRELNRTEDLATQGSALVRSVSLLRDEDGELDLALKAIKDARSDKVTLRRRKSDSKLNRVDASYRSLGAQKASGAPLSLVALKDNRSPKFVSKPKRFFRGLLCFLSKMLARTEALVGQCIYETSTVDRGKGKGKVYALDESSDLSSKEADQSQACSPTADKRQALARSLSSPALLLPDSPITRLRCGSKEQPEVSDCNSPEDCLVESAPDHTLNPKQALMPAKMNLSLSEASSCSSGRKSFMSSLMEKAVGLLASASPFGHDELSTHSIGLSNSDADKVGELVQSLRKNFARTLEESESTLLSQEDMDGKGD